MESSPSRSTLAAPATGMKRPASLLPAFEPLSSSPSLPRPQKRVAREPQVSTYPTPVPTSSTHILSSSPPGIAVSRPPERRTFSGASERAPLSAVPTIMLPDSGEPVLMGRSSASCHHQLAASRMISRVHVKATYKPAPNPFDRDRVEIMCMGWNGIKLHCQGKTYDLAKGKTFTSDIKDADIMIDVHEARVLVQWPRNEDRKDCPSTDSEQTWEETTPRQRAPSRREALQESPVVELQRMVSPISPSPAVQQALIPPSSPLFTPTRSRNAVVVYEDEASPIKRSHTVGHGLGRASALLQSSQGSSLSDLGKAEESSDNDEENDPIVHSFGPFGENLLPRMASFHTDDSPIRSARSPRSLLPTQPLQPSRSPRQPSNAPEHHVPDEPEVELQQPLNEHFERVRNHAANQLAFSRLSSTPFSTILNNLPPAFWKSDERSTTGPSRLEIRAILESTKCVGKVAREGKDAAGKALESEYYYIPDFDEDEMRREAVVNDLRKPGLRNCRKQHKQYFWRKPK
ncbi:hypothetical protein N7510_003469 [Penicillium lagena]|uniref:uncharacterized protein n=1 Tax=Penicillium lagena TaxID=94218 RepID=UPI002541AFDF|nr:uncharacterized protein N7510_003469 [Penicillium lagena]KAJ5619485.1 hypothetical protein N7510_003469 [Penicillium lagena]